MHPTEDGCQTKNDMHLYKSDYFGLEVQMKNGFSGFTMIFHYTALSKQKNFFKLEEVQNFPITTRIFLYQILSFKKTLKNMENHKINFDFKKQTT